jgi:hypothetical protein
LVSESAEALAGMMHTFLEELLSKSKRKSPL